MEQTNQYQWILEKYPATISKDQLYRLCGISKKTALHLLEHGLIPCKDSGKKTRRYTIAITDVIAYLEAREIYPDCFIAPEGWYAGKARDKCDALTPAEVQRMREYFITVLSSYPDVLNLSEICELTGYGRAAVTNWCNTQGLKHFSIGGRYLIPQTWAIEFFLGTYFRTIRRKSERHKDHLRNLKEQNPISQGGDLT